MAMSSGWVTLYCQAEDCLTSSREEEVFWPDVERCFT